LSYDANGNQLADAQYATNYGWDMENRLVASTSNGWPGAATWYAYDPWGKRVMKDVNADPRGLNGGLGYAGGAWEFYFYSITGQKLVTASCSSVSGWMACGGADNVYFGGKVVKSRGNVAVTDRLGSVRYSVGVSYSYFPYGEERTVTSDDTEKFGTYLRDGPGQDYAEQRYYNNGTGRFWSPDPSKGVDRGNPSTWNKYAYVAGDPINYGDPRGTNLVFAGYGCIVVASEWLNCGMMLTDDGGASSAPEGAGVDQGGGGPKRPVDQSLNSTERSLLNKRLANFGSSNCDTVFDDVIDGYSTSDFASEVTSVNFYNNTTDGSYTQNQVSGNSSSTALANTLSFGETAQTLNPGSSSPAIVLGANFFSNSSSVYQGNVLLHELLHAYTGWNDKEIFQFFQSYGLTNVNGDTEDIAAWLSTDCKSTPKSLTWWNQ
jgi:RHS repeat-associated protein